MKGIFSVFTVTLTLFTSRIDTCSQSRKHPAVCEFTEKYFSQTVDHFNFNSLGNGTFSQRYLITDKYWRKGLGPVFFYTGNEGDVWDFALNSGFIMELAAQQKALVIFGEHRYYGKSLPFGKDSFNVPQVGLLTVEQALADYAVMISELKQQLEAKDCPVIVFGGRIKGYDLPVLEVTYRSRLLTRALQIITDPSGHPVTEMFNQDSDIFFSYGGMLSVYMRLKYLNVVAGALAASAPILSTAGLGDPRQFFRDVTADFENVAPECRDAVRAAFSRLKDLADQKDYSQIQSKFGLCEPPSSERDVHQLNGLLRNAFTLMAMLDYPYSTHFMSNMPANPVKVGCETMLKGSDLLANLRNTAGIVYNSTGELACFDLYTLYVECADPTGCGLGFNSLAWDYQACTEIELCYESNNVTDMFPPMTFTEKEREIYCSKRWAVVPRPGWLKMQFWGDALSAATNIIFSNGDLDPWANGGVRKSLSPSLIALNIAGGAHHLDLRGSNEADPESVISVRKTEAEIISQWVKMEQTPLLKSL